MKRSAILGAVLALGSLGAAPVAAQTTMMDPETMESQFQTSGWDAVEVSSDEEHIEVEARRGAMEIEVVYDRSSGMVLDLDIENSDGRPVMIPGVTLTPAA